MAPLRLGITGIFPCFLMKSRDGRAVISFICNNMDDFVPISPSPELIKDWHIKLIACIQTSTAKDPLTEAHMDLECFSPFFPAQWRALFFNTPDPRQGAKLTVVLSIQIRSIFIFFLCFSRYSKDQKNRFHAHVFKSCINRMPIPKTGGQISPANTGS